ncbi:hypothetical protein D3C83_284660 [compost metagenome]
MKVADFEVSDLRRRRRQDLQHDLKERVPARVPFEFQMVDHDLERQVVVGKSVERTVPGRS